MSVLLVILNIVVVVDAVFLILLVVAQSNKGSDLGLFGGSAEMVFGSGQMRAVSRITITCALIMMFGVFLIGFLKSFSGNHISSESEKPSAVTVDSLVQKTPVATHSPAVSEHPKNQVNAKAK